MSLMQAYFDLVYNPVYDFVVGRLNPYRKLQEKCVGKLALKDNDRVLCVGLGTGNEVYHIFKMNRGVSIVGVDYSKNALRKARVKARALGKEIEVLTMDACHLQFADGSFNKVLCIHVMDFIKEREQATDEILRILKDGGRYVITYPSKKEGVNMGLNILRDSIGSNADSIIQRLITTAKCLGQMLVGMAYLPFFLRSNRALSRYELREMVTKLTGDFNIEEYPLYNDFIAWGTKSGLEVKSDASGRQVF